MDKLQTIYSGKKIQIIGAASGRGAKDQRCAQGPRALREHGLLSYLQARHAGIAWNDTIVAGARAGDDAAIAVSGVCKRLAQRVKACVGRGELPLVLGGDHSCAIGTWKGAAQALRPRGPLGLIWIDAHMDAHTPLSTPSGALHGMPLACLLGHGERSLTAIGGGITLQPQHICLIGVRSFETGEAALLRKLGVRIYFMPEVARRGLSAVVSEALTIVTTGCAGFGITLDLDALDPHDAPGVGSPVAGGLRSVELAAALPRVAMHPALSAIEIAEYNPERDRDCRTARVVMQLLDSLLHSLQPARGTATALERPGVKIDRELVHDR